MSEDIVVTVSPQVVVVEVADPNTLATAADAAQTAADAAQTAADAAQTAADRIQTGLDVVAANDSAVEALASEESATAQAVIATTKANSIRIDSATYAEIPSLTNPCFVFVATDETNDSEPTAYFFDGANLNWIPTVGV